ncbi:RraA family protein [Allopusillimonas soli]|uniref:Putative 4-hydroxy-4-methyl-2-oxoglutarate aldolase n=1 Tax=Allopusillimonas soli TaxID=659016 RepID=A0A853FG02_9BURK|nr:RraA family protein [Allopusillimonas soli]NYT38817.1 RraA family protein [Allopusillimonas soli]TEA70207.1 RraA family protein [Allopusillimonas soli]
MIGFRIYELQERVSSAWVEKFRDIPVANISDVMSRMSAGGAALRPMHAGGALSGPAFTVRTRPGDNLMVHKALDMAQAGDVIVVDAGGDLSNAIIGELMVNTAMRRGLAGIIIHGAIRDIGTISRGRFPVYAGGITHRGPYKDGPGEINVAVSLGGMVVTPGDLIVGDEDGLLCVPRKEAEAIHRAASEKQTLEARIMQDIMNDRLDVRWIDESLPQRGCDFAR